MNARAAPNLTTKLAATLLARGEIPYSDAKFITAAQIISLYEWHHNIRHAEGGSNEFWNYEPMLRAAHRKRTAKIDIPEIAKGKRIQRKGTEHKIRLAQRWIIPDRRKEEVVVRRRWPSRPVRRRDNG